MEPAPAEGGQESNTPSFDALARSDVVLEVADGGRIGGGGSMGSRDSPWPPAVEPAAESCEQLPVEFFLREGRTGALLLSSCPAVELVTESCEMLPAESLARDGCTGALLRSLWPDVEATAESFEKPLAESFDRDGGAGPSCPVVEAAAESCDRLVEYFARESRTRLVLLSPWPVGEPAAESCEKFWLESFDRNGRFGTAAMSAAS